MNKRQKKKRFKQTHAGISPEMWRSIYEENSKQWMYSIMLRDYAISLSQGLYIPIVKEKLKECLNTNYGITKEELYL